MRRLSSTLLVAFAALGASALGGCALTSADRAPEACVAGDVCAVPASGVFFLGATFSDAEVAPVSLAPVAVGGVQTVTALSGSNASSQPLSASFVASSSVPNELEVQAVTPPTIVLRGEAAGEASLELVDPGTNDVLGKDEVEVATIATATLFPVELGFFSFFEGAVVPPWALLGGTTSIGAGTQKMAAPAPGIPLVVRLADASGNRLVDEQLTVTSAESAESGTLSALAWDLVDVPAPAKHDTSYVIQAGGSMFPASAVVVTDVDSIELAYPTDASVPTVGTSAASMLCFAARSGEYAVAGASFKFEPQPGVTLSAEQPRWPSCVNLAGTSTGATAVAVTAGGMTSMVSVVVVAGDARRGPLGR